ncbi:MAG: HNH endonuclease [Pelagibacterium sp.]|uniref:HNH endonuclease n=1 Tax=Pelagibacterium sp. TaxID=1967288 RepID=UPI0032EB7C44
MGFGVFIHRADSIYDDSPATQYQFPPQYYSRVKSCIGDWIVYYEPTKVRNSRGYYAVARVSDVVRDPKAPQMFLALIEPGSYLPFTRSIPFVLDENVVETGLLNEVGRISGRAQAAVRFLAPTDFNRIVDLGLTGHDDLRPRSDALDSYPSGFEEEQVPFETERQRVSVLTSRILRDRVFRRVVLQAYDSRCGITGLKLINGGGRAEVEAAHIRPVEANGPDIINNGLPLSGTVHWMFDRGLITLADDLEIVISRQVNDRQGLESLINKTGRLIGPRELRDRPHPAFLSWHRENVFKH